MAANSPELWTAAIKRLDTTWTAQVGNRHAHVERHGQTIFAFSYAALIGVMEQGQAFVTDGDYSRTTARHKRGWTQATNATVKDDIALSCWQLGNEIQQGGRQ